MRKSYVVWAGRKPGVYDSWPECHRQIIGFKGAKFKSFPSQELAEEAFQSPEKFVDVSGVKSVSNGGVKPTTEELTRDYTYAIFCDGSCHPNPGPSGTGMAVFESGQLKDAFYGCFNVEGTNNTAELMGILQALDYVDVLVSDYGFLDNVVIYCDAKYALNAVTSWSYGWAKNGWRKADGDPIQNVAMIRSAHEQYLQLKNHVEFRHIKGHSGVDGNEFADQLALKGRLEEEFGWILLADHSELKSVKKRVA